MNTATSGPVASRSRWRAWSSRRLIAPNSSSRPSRAFSTADFSTWIVSSQPDLDRHRIGMPVLARHAPARSAPGRRSGRERHGRFRPPSPATGPYARRPPGGQQQIGETPAAPRSAAAAKVACRRRAIRRPPAARHDAPASRRCGSAGCAAGMEVRPVASLCTIPSGADRAEQVDLAAARGVGAAVVGHRLTIVPCGVLVDCGVRRLDKAGMAPPDSQ